MTKKHYIQLAAMFKNRYAEIDTLEENKSISYAEAEMARNENECFQNRVTAICTQDNPLFDRSRFLTACSIKDIDIV